jgi:hypothetical protein
LGVNEPIWAERAMYWGSNFEGGSAAGGATTLSKQWLFAEGSTKLNYFDNFLLLFNPQGEDANVSITYFLPDGRPPVVKPYRIPKQGRLTIHANSIAELANTDFSFRIDADQAIMAERSMYFGPNWVGGTNTVGAIEASSAWFFAEGVAAERFDTYYTVLNPNPSPITLSVSYLRDDGGVIFKEYPLAANSRSTISLRDELGLAGAVGAAFWGGGEPIVVERSIYWGAPWVEGTNSIGVTGASPTWHLPEGTTKNGFETFVLIANLNDFPVVARVTAMREDGQNVITDFTLLPHSRRTVYLNDADAFPHLQNQSFSTTVDVLDGQSPVIVEHAIYWRRDGANYWRGGSSAFGIK